MLTERYHQFEMKLVVIILLLPVFLYSQDFQSDFYKYCEVEDTLKQLETLNDWQDSNPEDPELYVAWFNYYFNAAREEVILMKDEPSDGESIVVKDSLGEPISYLTSQIVYDKHMIKNALSTIDIAIEKFPNRLDMRFGKIYVLGLTEDWISFKNEIIKSIHFSKEINNEWLWSNNETVSEGEEVFLNGIQDYQYQLHETSNESIFMYVEDIANEILKYYPSHIESISGLGAVYLVKGDYDLGIAKFNEALSINPSDVIVLLNLAKGYELIEDFERAKSTYARVVDIGEPNYVDFAKGKIKELENY